MTLYSRANTTRKCREVETVTIDKTVTNDARIAMTIEPDKAPPRLQCFSVTQQCFALIAGANLHNVCLRPLRVAC